MKVETKLRQVVMYDHTRIHIDTFVDGIQLLDSTIVVSGPTAKIGHLDPNVNTLENYYEALGH